MSRISIDIETYSSADLSKCGLYKYAQSGDFQVLLFAYSVDGGPVEVIDVEASGTRALPYEVFEQLFDFIREFYKFFL